ncbi:MAG: Fic family protein [Planctomycetes bacterium]|nr:Fic family protein [Planctomycetota bacterium]
MFEPELIASYVYNSNRLDGISLSEAETLRILSEQIDPESDVAGEDGKTFEAEVVLGHDRALRGMGLTAQSTGPFTGEQLLLLHKTLMGNLLLSAGEYRECTLRYKGLLIASPPEHLQERMDWLVNLINTGLERAQDPHKFSWRIHHEFITLHPFIEANGRLARLLLNLIRLRRGLDLTVVPFADREAYSRAILEFQQQKILRARERASSAE